MAASNEQMKRILIGLIAVFCCAIVTDGDKIGVNYGMLGDNLPPADQVVTLLNGHNIGKMKLFNPDGGALNAFANSGIDVIVGVSNNDLQAISSSQDSANAWVNDNIVPYSSTSIKYIVQVISSSQDSANAWVNANIVPYSSTSIKYIAVGNEVLPSTQYVSYLVPAMNNIQTAIQNANLQNIKVSTPHAFNVIGISYPPSQGAFSDDVKDTMSSILKFLSDNGAPFMANVYPYFSYAADSNGIDLGYALFQTTATAVTDGDHSYSNLFDAMVDSIFSAMEALGYSNIPLIVTESGWPSAGADAATTENAQTYNNNLIQHVLSNSGTPKRPGTNIETYIFALFNEEQKTGHEIERHFGLFNPDQSAAYPVNFSPN